MKKILSLVLIATVICSVAALISCGSSDKETTTTSGSKSTSGTSGKISATSSTTEEAQTTTQMTPAQTTQPSTTQTTAVQTTEKPIIEKPAILPEGKSFKVLAIGNSFSVDAMQYLYGLAKDAGYTDIVLGNLYIGGCTLETHANNIGTGKAAYEFYTNKDGKWTSRKNATIAEGLKYADWNCITIQQASGYSGLEGSYEPYLSTIIQTVRKVRPNAKLVWHMTWAYQTGSGHADFAKYGNSQSAMYKDICSSVQSAILQKHADDFDGVIPSGTAIQNLRTSFIGDNVTRDGYHLSYDAGRYTAALAWLKALTGADLSGISYIPADYGYVFGTATVNAAKEAVNYACAYPFEVTKSTVINDADKTQKKADLEKLGLDPEKFTAIELDLVPCSYYYSRMAGMKIQSKIAGVNDENVGKYAASRVIPKDELPVGSVIIIDEGYQYRPEGWSNAYVGTPNSKRPAETSENVVRVTDGWWDDFRFRAFNVSKVGAPNLSDEEMTSLSKVIRVYVPKVEKVEPEKPDLSKIDLSKYTKLDLGITYYAYYNSTSATPGTIVSRANGSKAANISQFATTKIFSKSDIPEGSIIVIKSGYQYRPDGWTALDKKTASRPANVLTEAVIVDENWWGQFNYRTFNIAKMGNPNLSDSEMRALSDVLTIYVPKN